MPTSPTNHRVLLVDDDPVILRIYRDGLSRSGFTVSTAADGLAALRAIQSSAPDIVVLDLMMPKFSGAEVLQFIRSHKETESLPVIVLSNAYMDPMAHDAARLGAQKGLLKVKCNVRILVQAIQEVLEGTPAAYEPEQLLAVPVPPSPPEALAAPPPEASEAIPASQPQPNSPSSATTESSEQALHELSLSGPAFDRSFREDCAALLKAADAHELKARLESLHRKLRFLSSLAGLAEYQALSELSGALEALLFAMMDKTQKPSPTLSKTLSDSAQALQALLIQHQRPQKGPVADRRVLLVGFDRVYARPVISALRNAQVQGRATENTDAALALLRQTPCQAVVLNADIAGTNACEFCQRLRLLDGYAQTPIICISAETESKAQQQLSAGASAVMTRPELPAELAVKTVMQFLASPPTPAAS